MERILPPEAHMLELSRQEQARRRYQAQRPGWRPAGDVLNALLEPLLLPHVRALDAGCGRWGVLGRFQERVGLAVGVDADFPSLRENRILPFRAQARLEALPFPARTFDLILCTWVIEHLPEPRAAFQEIARVLKPGGHLLLLTPNARHPLVALGHAIPSRWRRPLVRRLYGRAPQDIFPTFYRANTPGALRRLLRAAGLQEIAWFEVEDPTYLAFHPFLFALAALYERLTAWRPLRGWRLHLIGLFARPLADPPSPE
jgi:SAM-dependent methyltransferase